MATLNFKWPLLVTMTAPISTTPLQMRPTSMSKLGSYNTLLYTLNTQKKLLALLFGSSNVENVTLLLTQWYCSGTTPATMDYLNFEFPMSSSGDDNGLNPYNYIADAALPMSKLGIKTGN